MALIQVANTKLPSNSNNSAGKLKSIMYCGALIQVANTKLPTSSSNSAGKLKLIMYCGALIQVACVLVPSVQIVPGMDFSPSFNVELHSVGALLCFYSLHTTPRAAALTSDLHVYLHHLVNL